MGCLGCDLILFMHIYPLSYRDQQVKRKVKQGFVWRPVLYLRVNRVSRVKRLIKKLMHFSFISVCFNKRTLK